MEDVRECPGTAALSASWVLVFVLMLLVQWRLGIQVPRGAMGDPLPMSTLVSHRFGDMTWAEVRRGEVWRLVTATFVHFGLIHVALNVLGLINLGRLIEPWYRTGPFLAVCLAIGGLGNLTGGVLRQLAAASRPWLSSTAVVRHWPGLLDRFIPGGPAGPAMIPSGGGSTILLGLLALGAVVGWRSRTRIGLFLGKQMFVLIVLTGVLGILMYKLVDNYGHLGGAIVGAAIGFVHRPLIRLAERRTFRRLAWGSVALVMVTCLVAAVRDDRFEVDRNRRVVEVVTRAQAAETVLNDLNRLYGLYGRSILRSEYFREPNFALDAVAVGFLLEQGPKLSPMSKPDPEQVARDRAELEEVLDRLGRTPTDLWGEAVARDIARLRELARSTLQDGPRYDQAYEFVVCWRSAVKAIAEDITRLNARMMELDAIVRQTR